MRRFYSACSFCFCRAVVFCAGARLLWRVKDAGGKEKIDESWGNELGNKWATEKEYAKGVELYTTGFANHLKTFSDDQNVFLLCFENLDDVYTEEDEMRYGPTCKAGTNKVCHRTWLSRILNKKKDLKIEEWESDK